MGHLEEKGRQRLSLSLPNHSVFHIIGAQEICIEFIHSTNISVPLMYKALFGGLGSSLPQESSTF